MNQDLIKQVANLLSQMSANTKNAAGMHLKKLVKECMENNWLVADEIEL